MDKKTFSSNLLSIISPANKLEYIRQYIITTFELNFKELKLKKQSDRYTFIIGLSFGFAISSDDVLAHRFNDIYDQLEAELLRYKLSTLLGFI